MPEKGGAYRMPGFEGLPREAFGKDSPHHAHSKRNQEENAPPVALQAEQAKRQSECAGRCRNGGRNPNTHRSRAAMGGGPQRIGRNRFPVLGWVRLQGYDKEEKQIHDWQKKQKAVGQRPA
ncbi:MAG: hypothetical protein OHK0021_05760 [Bryobacter sp.]